MKNKDRRNIDRKKYFTAVFSLVFVLAVMASVSLIADSSTKGQNIPQGEISQIEPDEVKPVDVNKNAAPKISNPKEETTKPLEKLDDKKVSDDKSEQTQPQKNSEPKASKEELSFSWPLEGEIVLDYSGDKAVYDPTLDQYRTNDNLCISAPEKTAVKASAAGEVEKVYESYESGYSVVIDHKDGFKTTYSQRGEDVAVKEGEKVSQGQVLGYVGKTSPYGAALGSHLEFSMSQNDENVDPKSLLK